jgi:protein-S-isoprenylcysteine O-methyltransferase Ste14
MSRGKGIHAIDKYSKGELSISVKNLTLDSGFRCTHLSLLITSSHRINHLLEFPKQTPGSERAFPFYSVVFFSVLTISWLIFRRVGKEYERHQKLSPLSTILETAVFFMHGISSYAFLDSKFSSIKVDDLTFVISVVLILLGLIGTILSMSRLGFAVTLGRDPNTLRRSGLYRYTRNPQIVSYFLVVAGYSVLWPSLSGVLWVMLYMLIAHIMVLTEEQHLLNFYGDVYMDYCRRTPRYIGLPS